MFDDVLNIQDNESNDIIEEDFIEQYNEGIDFLKRLEEELSKIDFKLWETCWVKI